MFGYEYIDLKPAQLQRRRYLLDQAGSQGCMAPFIILAAVWMARVALSSPSNLSPAEDGREEQASDAKTPPPAKQSPSLRRLRWRLSSTYYTSEFGPLHVLLTGFAYTSYLLYLITRNTGNDYMHLAKAFGHVVVSQLPSHYLLSLKDARSPVTIATGLTHERLNAYHRLFGRILHSLLACHAILYLKFFIDKGILLKRLGDWDVRLGVMAFWSANFLAILSVPPIRKAVYHQVFYRSHVVLSMALLVVLWFHVPYTRSYVQQAGLAWVVNGMLRTMVTEEAEVTCQKVGGDGELVEVVARVPAGNWKKWVPGMHGYLSQGGLGPRNPYTIVSVAAAPNEKADVKMVVKNLGGPGTVVLGKRAEDKKDGENFNLQLEGPYGEAEKYMPGLTAQGSNGGEILVVAGGIGATYSLPVYLALLKARKGQTQGLRLVWIVKSMRDAAWGLEKLQKTQGPVDVRLFISQFDNNVADEQDKSGISGLHITKTGSRPSMAKIVDEFFDDAKQKDGQNMSRADKVTVMVCGPSGLFQSLRAGVGKHVLQHDRDVDWHEEQFGFGGS